jgi:hypothetical protein
MDSRLLLVTAITLLYNESLIEPKAGNSADIVKEALGTIRLPDVAPEGDKARDILVSLLNTARWMAENPPEHTYERSTLLQRIRVSTAGDESLYSALAEYINAPEATQDTLRETALAYKYSLRDHLNLNKVKELIYNANKDISFNQETIDIKNFTRELVGELEPFIATGMDKAHPAMVGEVDFSDLQDLENKLAESAAELSVEGVMRTGIQAINRLCGTNKGFRRGEFILLSALQHKFKSGMAMTLFKQIPLYNKPFMRDPTKKPLIIRMSLENNLKSDIIWLYKSLKENETGEYCDCNNINVTEAAAYVNAKLTVNGYHVMMKHYDPSEFTFYDLFDFVTKLEADGYEIHFFEVDYLNMMSKRGLSQGPTGSEIRELFRRTRNFMAKRGITFLTPHQLSSEAKQLVRNGVDDFVQVIAEKGYYDGCKGLDQEVDLEIYIHIEQIGAESYLTVQRGKHRGLVEMTSHRDKYCVLKFNDIGAILDDIEGRDLSMRHIGGAPVSEGGGKAWFS